MSTTPNSKHPTTSYENPRQQTLPGIDTGPAVERIRSPRGPADTSQAAAEAADAAPDRDRRRRVALAIIQGRGPKGCTRDELAGATGWPIQSVCPVVAVLIRAGEVRDSGQRRPTRTGRAAQVLVATGRGG